MTEEIQKKKKNTFPFLSLQKYLREWKWSKNLWSKLPNLYKNSTFLLVILISMLNQRYYIHWSLSKKKKTTHPLTCCSSSSNSLEEVPNSRMGCVQGWFPWADTIESQVSSDSPTSSAIVRVRYRWNRRRSPCNPSTRSSRSYRRKIMADRWSNNDRSGLFFDLVAHVPVVIDHFHYEADVLDVLRGHVEHQDLVVHREQSVLLHRGLLLFDPSVLAQQVHFHVRICKYVS